MKICLTDLRPVEKPELFQGLLEADDEPLYYQMVKRLPAPGSSKATRSIHIVFETSRLARQAAQVKSPRSSLWKIQDVFPLTNVVPAAWEVYLSWTSFHVDRDDAPRPTCGFPTFKKSQRHEDYDLVCFGDDGRNSFVFDRALLSQAIAA